MKYLLSDTLDLEGNESLLDKAGHRNKSEFNFKPFFNVRKKKFRVFQIEKREMKILVLKFRI